MKTSKIISERFSVARPTRMEVMPSSASIQGTEASPDAGTPLTGNTPYKMTYPLPTPRTAANASVRAIERTFPGLGLAKVRSLLEHNARQGAEERIRIGARGRQIPDLDDQLHPVEPGHDRSVTSDLGRILRDVLDRAEAGRIRAPCQDERPRECRGPFGRDRHRQEAQGAQVRLEEKVPPRP